MSLAFGQVASARPRAADEGARPRRNPRPAGEADTGGRNFAPSGQNCSSSPLISGTCGHTGGMTDPAGTQDLVRCFYDDLWNAWDDEAVDAVLSPDFAFRGSLGVQTVGRDGWRRYRDDVRSGAPDFHNEIVTLVVDDRAAAVRLRYTGTHLGPLAGMAATGRRFCYAGAAFFTTRSGRLASAWVLGDLSGLRSQLAPRPE